MRAEGGGKISAFFFHHIYKIGRSLIIHSIQNWLKLEIEKCNVKGRKRGRRKMEEVKGKWFTRVA